MSDNCNAKLLFFALVFFGFAGGGIGVASAAALDGDLQGFTSFIRDPMFGKPAIWRRGDNATKSITLDAAYGAPDAESWSVTLQKANGPAQLAFELGVESVQERQGRVLLQVRVPGSLPEDLYDLSVAARKGGELIASTQPNSVSIIAALKTSYSIAHVTDIHADDPRGLLLNFSESIGYAFIKKMIRMVNLINPAFVVMTGDHVFGNAYWYEYAHLYEVLQGFDVPIFMAIGNHDAINHAYWHADNRIDGMQAFQDLFAPLTYAVRYGSLEYITLNSMDWSAFQRRGAGIVNIHFNGRLGEEQLDWYEEQLAASEASLIVAGLHHPPHNSFGGPGAERFMELSAEYGVEAVVAGHTHGNDVIIIEGVRYITTTSLAFSGIPGSSRAFRLLKIENDELAAWNYEEPDVPLPLYRQGPQWSMTDPALFCSYSPANDGAATAITATIENHLQADLEGLSLELYVRAPAAGSTYAVSGAEVVETCTAGDVQIWYVRADVGAETVKEVKIDVMGGE
ncbi:MAG: hypothetical protein GY868_00635 [Deltaproteobacteria bacterium]|nr:hypothetical protein [Deltaproteobacteria bacterium]